MYASLHQILSLFTGGCIPLHNNAERCEAVLNGAAGQFPVSF